MNSTTIGPGIAGAPHDPIGMAAPEVRPLGGQQTAAQQARSNWRDDENFIYVHEGISSIQDGSGTIAVVCDTVGAGSSGASRPGIPADKNFYKKMEAMQGRPVQRLALRYAASKGLAQPAMRNTPIRYPANAAFEPIDKAQTEFDAAKRNGQEASFDKNRLKIAHFVCLVEVGGSMISPGGM